MKSWLHRMCVPSIALCAAACSQQTVDSAPLPGQPSAAGGMSAGGAPSLPNASGGVQASGGNAVLPTPMAGNPGVAGSTGIPSTCTAEFADTGLEPVYLAFAFDVSGSMGKGDEPYHNAELKWKPVVSATKAFFADPSSSGISASLSFFPAGEDKCEAESYEQPDVDMTALPSGAFATAIDGVTPQSADDWRGGTPTLAVITGMARFIQARRSQLGAGKFAMVLVSDGYPQGCDDDEDSIDAVAASVGSVAAELPTYVIGVSNPEGGPDTVSNLKRIAEAGKTERAFLVETGDPEKTSRDFKAVIDSIRGSSLSCQAAIPKPPDGSTLDTGKVNVSYTAAGVRSELAYDATCTVPNAWRFDNADAPTRIELCEAACGHVQGTPNIKLNVEFGCQTRPAIPR